MLHASCAKCQGCAIVDRLATSNTTLDDLGRPRFAQFCRDSVEGRKQTLDIAGWPVFIFPRTMRSAVASRPLYMSREKQRRAAIADRVRPRWPGSMRGQPDTSTTTRSLRLLVLKDYGVELIHSIYIVHVNTSSSQAGLEAQRTFPSNISNAPSLSTGYC